jgi:peptidoglycan/LPS O-acetylase OafA/YrhL
VPGPVPLTSDTPRLHALDGLRGLAAAGIVLVHVWLYARVEEAQGSALGIGIYQIRLGIILFFALSGYLLFAPWVRAALTGMDGPSVRKYALRRAARILPLYYVVLVVSILTLVGTGSTKLPAGEHLWTYFVFAQNFSLDTVAKLNPPLWTLAVEVSFYVVLPLIGWVALRLGTSRARLMALMALLAAAGVAYDIVAWQEAFRLSAISLLPAYLPAFAAGMAVAVLTVGRTPSARASRVMLVAGTAGLAACVVLPMLGHDLRIQALRDLPSIPFFALILAGCLGGRPTPILASRPLQRLGDLSYGIYLWHMPVILFLWARGWWPSDSLLLGLLATVPATLVLSYASWLVIERPAIAWARRRTTAPRPRRAERRAPHPAPRPTPQPALSESR